MSTPEQLPAGAARAWAVAQLGLDPECSRAEIQQACWTRLAADEFASEGSHVEAIELLLFPAGEQTIPPPASQFRHDFEQSLDADLAQFTEQFFDIIPWQRQQQWFALTSRAAAWPRQRGRLNSLKDGLSVDLHRLIDQDANAHRVAAWCGELFMSPPPARSARKLELLAGLRDPTNAWMVRHTARQLSNGWPPEIVDLAPDLIDEISQHRQLVRRRGSGQKTTALHFRAPQEGIVWRVYGSDNSCRHRACDDRRGNFEQSAGVGFLQGPSKSRPGPDRLENQLNKRQSLPIISIDVEELLKAEDPYQAIATHSARVVGLVVVATWRNTRKQSGHYAIERKTRRPGIQKFLRNGARRRHECISLFRAEANFPAIHRKRAPIRDCQSKSSKPCRTFRHRQSNNPKP